MARATPEYRIQNERSGAMTREEIINANPIVDLVRSRGHERKPAGQKLCHECVRRVTTTQTRASAWYDLPGKQQLVRP